MPNILVEQKYLDEIISIIRRVYPKAVVWAYGSRIDGTAHTGSDLDLVIKDYGQKDAYLFELKEELEESNIPFLIDIFELDKLPENFQKEIKKNYVVLYDGSATGN
ncbi:MAG: nucleotidyltransferase domain-containing protein [Candidatus Gastranaerophilales bacterium]|nr:nucleotidyltransferase domain-containing protein [Candidatus Gastranaerophilales bacterium]